MVEILFWLTLITILYSYAGYPLLLIAASAVFKKPVTKSSREPKVSVIMSAFNEERNIENKLRNLLDLDYPDDKMEILIGSDGAFDKTDQIISQFPSGKIRFFRFVKNQGKPAILNSLVREAGGTILIFTDVRQQFDSKAVRELVANFADPQVGCVSGELYFKHEEPGDKSQETREGTQATEDGLPPVSRLLPHAPSMVRGMGAYWSYEKFLRKKESDLGSMLGATGAIYAVRRKYFRPVPQDMLVDDMYIPLSIIQQGYRAVFDSTAKAYDIPSESGKQEFKRKVRTLAGNYQIFSHFWELFNPFKSPVAVQLFSHKLLRVLIPFFLLILFIMNLFLVLNPFYLGFFVAQILFYGMAAVESFQAESKRKGVGYLPYTFCLLNVSAVVGFIRFLRGADTAAWEKAYD